MIGSILTGITSENVQSFKTTQPDNYVNDFGDSMKILVVQESDWIKRNPHQQHHLMERLSLKGHQIKVIDYNIDWRIEKRSEIISGITTYDDIHKIYPQAKIQVIRPGTLRIPGLDYASLWYTHRKEIKHQIRDFKPDVIVGFGILNTYAAARIANKNKIPIVYYWIDSLDALIPIKYFRLIGKYLEQSTLKRSSKVITINKKLEEYVIKLGANKEKTCVISAGIDLSKFDMGIDGSEIRQKYGIKKGDIVLFFMGWIYHFSGLKEVVTELARTRDINKNIKLLIVGDGDAFSDLKKIIVDNRLEDQVILTGKQPYDTIPKFLSASDICILPAYTNEIIMRDIVPIKMYEYMAMGKPVITTKLPGIVKEFGEDNGVLYVDNPGDVVERSKIAHNNTINEYGLKARTFAGKHNWEDITNEFESELKKVTGSCKAINAIGQIE
jgi:glycosyltransferase involved in cell wall biosynthesis